MEVDSWYDDSYILGSKCGNLRVLSNPKVNALDENDRDQSDRIHNGIQDKLSVEVLFGKVFSVVSMGWGYERTKHHTEA